jgi:hypothetical protein
MTSRRSIAERVIARARDRGAPIDDDPEFMAIVELWVAGEIETDGMRDRYNALLRRRSRDRGRDAAVTDVRSDGQVATATDEIPDGAEL